MNINQVFSLLTLCFLTSPPITSAQQNIPWGELSEVEWIESYDSLSGIVLLEGNYSNYIKILDSAEVYGDL